MDTKTYIPSSASHIHAGTHARATSPKPRRASGYTLSAHCERFGSDSTEQFRRQPTRNSSSATAAASAKRKGKPHSALVAASATHTLDLLGLRGMATDPHIAAAAAAALNASTAGVPPSSGATAAAAAAPTGSSSAGGGGGAYSSTLSVSAAAGLPSASSASAMAMAEGKRLATASLLSPPRSALSKRPRTPPPPQSQSQSQQQPVLTLGFGSAGGPATSAISRPTSSASTKAARRRAWGDATSNTLTAAGLEQYNAALAHQQHMEQLQRTAALYDDLGLSGSGGGGVAGGGDNGGGAEPSQPPPVMVSRTFIGTRAGREVGGETEADIRAHERSATQNKPQFLWSHTRPTASGSSGGSNPLRNVFGENTDTLPEGVHKPVPVRHARPDFELALRQYELRHLLQPIPRLSRAPGAPDPVPTDTDERAVERDHDAAYFAEWRRSLEPVPLAPYTVQSELLNARCERVNARDAFDDWTTDAPPLVPVTELPAARLSIAAGTFAPDGVRQPHSRYSYNPTDSLSFAKHLRRGYGLRSYVRPKFSFAHSAQLGAAAVLYG